MKINVVKNYIRKIIAAIFCAVMLIYGQCSHAVIEKYLTPVSANLYKLGDKRSCVEIESEELATEIISYLKIGVLCEICIHIPHIERRNNIRWLILESLLKILPSSATLTSFYFGRNEIGDEGATTLAGALQNNTTLTELDLGGNEIGDEGTIAIVEALKNNIVLTGLYFGGNRIGIGGTLAIARALQNNTALTRLYLEDNEIGDEGATILAGILQNNTTLTELDLGVNRIGILGAIELARVLQNNTMLAELRLEGNQIGDEGVRVLAEALRYNTALTTFNLEGNQIGDEGVRILAEALRYNMALITFNLEGNQIGDERAQAVINKILLRNSLLTSLLRKIKRASSFTFGIGLYRTCFGYVLPNILEFAGLNVHNRGAFKNTQVYNSEDNRHIIFRGNLEEVIRLFYYGNHANYEEIIREINQIRRLQREIFQIPESELPELSENTFLIPKRLATIFFGVS